MTKEPETFEELPELSFSKTKTLEGAIVQQITYHTKARTNDDLINNICFLIELFGGDHIEDIKGINPLSR